ncbi:MAG: hypothetical protein R3D60_09940 [Paracoccaceae bacterium]
MLRFASLALIAAPAFADTPGFREFTLAAAHRPAPLSAAVYYPAGAGGEAVREGDNIIFSGVDVRRDAPAAGTGLPLILVSHGSGGNYHGLAWLGAGLAEGAIVAMVNHPGSTSRDSTPTQTAFLDRRAHDISALLDAVLADPQLAGRIDPDRIAVLGFSLGGGTALQLAGARFDRAAYRQFCATYTDEATGCDWMQSDGFDLTQWPASAEDDLRDPRISSLIAIDPAFGHSWRPESLAAMNLPALLINLGETGPGTEWFGVGVGPDSANLPGQMPDARYRVVPDAWHFSMLPECRFFAPLLTWWEGEDPICSDAWGWDRAGTHATVIGMVSDFVDGDARLIGPGVAMR